MAEFALFFQGNEPFTLQGNTIKLNKINNLDRSQILEINMIVNHSYFMHRSCYSLNQIDRKAESTSASYLEPDYLEEL